MTGTDGQAEGDRGAQCPLCGTTLVERTRDPLVRAGGLALLYAAAMMLLTWLPSLTPWKAAAVLDLALGGVRGARARRSLWCPGCWYAGSHHRRAG